MEKAQFSNNPEQKTYYVLVNHIQERESKSGKFFVMNVRKNFLLDLKDEQYHKKLIEIYKKRTEEDRKKIINDISFYEKEGRIYCNQFFDCFIFKDKNICNVENIKKNNLVVIKGNWITKSKGNEINGKNHFLVKSLFVRLNFLDNDVAKKVENDHPANAWKK
ncbi:hypothetical protein MCAV_02170 [[Mycoplasma] cavipharyngis]|uniref:hypothetical protein n=1 Tax=[Mycoplasma] cavipharyngis TaxID=92757 RepID=UPI0037049A12